MVREEGKGGKRKRGKERKLQKKKEAVQIRSGSG